LESGPARLPLSALRWGSPRMAAFDCEDHSLEIRVLSGNIDSRNQYEYTFTPIFETGQHIALAALSRSL
jgi:hypothetical protein